MSQHDLHIANQLFPAFRTALNNALSALGSSMIGSSAPPSPLAGMLWIDNSAAVWRKKLYDGTDWITIAEIDPASNEHCPYVKSFKFEPTAMASALVPDADASRDLGSAANRWGTLHAAAIEGLADALIPDADAVRDLGTAANRWGTLHAAAVDGVASVNGGPLAGFRNAVINGNFDIWQRGTSQTSNGYGSDDRWFNDHNGSTKTHSRQAFSLGQTDVPGNPQFFSRTMVTSVAGAGNFVLKSQKIEDVRAFAGETVTLSFWAKADASRELSVGLVQYFGSGGSPSAPVFEIGVTKVVLTTAWQRFAMTISLPSISGKTLGINGDSSLQIVFWFDAGTTYNSRTASLGHQSGIFDIAQVQLEPGNVATAFERRPIGAELALAQRYYWQEIGRNHWIFSAYMVAGGNNWYRFSYPAPMRAPPSITRIGDFSLSNLSQPDPFIATTEFVYLIAGVFVTGVGSATSLEGQGFTFDAEL